MYKYNSVYVFISFKVKVKYKTLILSLVLYGCDTWFFTLREEQRFKVFEKGVLRKILGPKRQEAKAGRRKLHTRSCVSLILHKILLGDQIKEDEM